MPCLNPMLAYRTDVVNPDTGKYQYRFVGALKNYDVDDQLRQHGTVQIYDDRGKFIVDKSTGEVTNRAKILACGQCIGCRTKRAASWADRIIMEAKHWDKVYFLTLTYDDNNVPVSLSKDGVTSMTLEPKDLQDFIKRLRREQEYHYSNKIRFYAVGEYGEQFHRPHYHMIAFGLILDDIKEHHRNRAGRMIHTSETIEKIWQNGLIEVEDLSWELAAYAARYCVKKLGKDETEFYETFGLVPEFQRCSQGFGRDYFEEHMDEIYQYDEIYIATAAGGRKLKPPRYYDRLYDDIYPAQMAVVKGNREKVAQEAMKLKMNRTNLSYPELLEQQEAAFKNKIKQLRRTLE